MATRTFWVVFRKLWVIARKLWVTARKLWVTARKLWVVARTLWVVVQTVWVTVQEVWVAVQTVWVAVQKVWVTAQKVWVTVRKLWINFRAGRVMTGAMFASNSGYEFSIVVSKRGSADSWQVWATLAGENKWKLIATATGKSTDVIYTPLDTDNPIPYQLNVRVQLRRNNADYGETSLVAPVTVSP